MRILSLDPGTNTTGVSIFDVDYPATKLIFSETIKAEKLSKNHPFIEELHGARYAKIKLTGARVGNLISIYKPDAIVSESPYMGRFAQSFAALTELVAEFRNIVFEYDCSMYLETIDPATVKKFMGVKGTSGDKDLMRKAVIIQPLLYDDEIDLLSLDEHSIDSIAVGLCYIDKLFH